MRDDRGHVLDEEAAVLDLAILRGRALRYGHVLDDSPRRHVAGSGDLRRHVGAWF